MLSKKGVLNIYIEVFYWKLTFSSDTYTNELWTTSTYKNDNI